MARDKQRDQPFPRTGSDRLLGEYPVDKRTLEMALPYYLEVPDTGTAGDLMQLFHGTGRIPNEVIVARSQFTDAVGVYSEAGDPVWTARDIWVRFNKSNARVLLRIT